MPGSSLWDRPTLDIVVLLFAVVIAASLIGGGAAIMIITLRHPEVPVDNAIDNLTTSLNQILAALLGLIAGHGLTDRQELVRPSR